MKQTKQSLEEQLASAEKIAKEAEQKAESIRKKIESEKSRNKPKDITDRVKNLNDVLKIAKPTKEEMALINYSGRSERLIFSKYMLILSLISEVLNEGHKFTMDSNERRWFPYFYNNSSGAGLVFCDSLCYDAGANTSSAAHLCLKSEKLSNHAGKILLQHYKNAIMPIHATLPKGQKGTKK